MHTITITIDNITTNKYLIIYTDNCELTILKDNDILSFKKNSFIFIERGMNFSCTIKKEVSGKHPYRAIRLNKEELIILKDILVSVHKYQLDKHIATDNYHDKLTCINGTQEHFRIFNSIDEFTNRKLKMLQLAYMVSYMGIAPNIITSLISSAAITFTDKVRSVLEKDISKKWRLHMIADEFNLAEVSVRKRLESEGTSFNDLLIETRMSKAMSLLLNNELQIHQISKEVGILSSSYFIKMFKNHFGVTPKQFIIYFRT
ncbi:CFA/I fimbrial subunit D [Escherichia coli]|uniref:helix-turn-helix transcriptional regulator n=1 Tax=Escherichia coli TaxID=562 RepID=UPI000E1DB95D|nr:response regulator transcription factor [Escherichia coli]EFN8783523.1 AraC family transcriptional regulator [Escherichia coli]EHS0425046.1 helix-turn-helix transcriptional regulator [Escherichia coli]RDP45331.1 CFA/I fimbrial subunit D [Escherichia coli]HBA9677357.1 helix-turn-helix transcriptional regulator [Escherichia coli]HBB0203966.1 helix-turn-helix transcriptional regulator [Escherichia coli]